MQRQTYVFMENDAIVPIENTTYIIYHDPAKKSFQYDQKYNKCNKLVQLNVN